MRTQQASNNVAPRPGSSGAVQALPAKVRVTHLPHQLASAVAKGHAFK
jgi:hypothetical protein